MLIPTQAPTQDSNVLVVEDPLGIVYLIENSQQFWSELEDVVHIPSDNAPTLSLLDSALKRFISLCASYHEQYLQSPFQLEHACELLLSSELFAFHSERMCEILTDEAQSNTDPHFQFIVYNILLHHGRRKSTFLRSQKRWQLLMPLLMDHVLVEIDPDVEDMYLGGGSRVNDSFMIPIEAKLRSLGVKLLYEVCRVQKLSVQDLRIFDDSFIDHLFDLVEQTRGMQDETFNYSVIKLIVSLNEQFMVASLGANHNTQQIPAKTPESQNRVLHVLVRRLGASKTFGENMIFMLNRANRTAEDLCMQLLVLKILYLLFTTKGTSEYFYTNDLCVLVDVFLRELVDLDEDSESLRHTFLRVLHPLLTKTQLRDVPYKRAQIVLALESLMENSQIRDIDPTTKRLVERCLNGEWCVHYRKAKVVKEETRGDVEGVRIGSPGSDSVASAAQTAPAPSTSKSSHLERHGSGKSKTLKMSKSVENLKAKSKPPRPPRPALNSMRPPSADSAGSLPGVAAATTSALKRKDQLRSGEFQGSFAAQQSERHHHNRSGDRPLPARADSLGTGVDGLALRSHPLRSPSPNTSAVSLNINSKPQPGTTQRRSAPPAPTKRRKPPAVPTEKTNSGATITPIASSNSSQTAKVTKTSGLQHAIV